MKVDPSLYSGGQPPSPPPPQRPQGGDGTLHSAFPATPQPQHENPSPYPPQNPSMFAPQSSNATLHGAHPATPPPPQPPQGGDATLHSAFPATQQPPPKPQPQHEKPSPYPPQNPSMFTPQGSNATLHGSFPTTPPPAPPQPQYEKPNPYPPQHPPMFTPQGNYNNFPPQNQQQPYPPPPQAYPPFGQDTSKGATSTTSYSGYDQAAKFPPQSSPHAVASYYSQATNNPTYVSMPPPASPLKQTAHHATGVPMGSPYHHHQSSPFVQPPSATSTSWKGTNGQPNIDPGKVCGAVFRLVSAILGLSSLLSCACRTNVSRGVDGTGPPVMESHCVWNFCDLCGDDKKEHNKHNHPQHSPYYGSMGNNTNMPMQYQQQQAGPGMTPPLNQDMRV